MGLEDMSMHKQVKYMKVSGEMIFGMERVNIPLSRKMLLFEELGKMACFTETLRWFIKMVKGLQESMLITKKMAKELFNTKMEQFLRELSRTIEQTDMES